MSTKKGLAFYRLDTDRYQDKRIKRLRKDFKRDGVAIYDYILCEIYRVEGSFILWDESTAFDVADYWELKETVLSEIVNYCCAVGLFDKRLFTSERVLTSGSIQRRYAEICKKMKRTVIIPEKYVIPPEVEAKIPEVEPEIPEVFTQSREEKSREEKSKGEGETRARATFPENLKTKNGSGRNYAAAENFRPPPLKEVEEFFKTDPEIPIFWPPAKRETEAGKYFHHYQGNGWLQANGNLVVDWRSQAKSWIAKEQEGAFARGVKNNNSPPPAAQKLLAKIERDINILYSDFTSNPVNISISNIDTAHYEYLMKKEMINFSEDMGREIRNQAKVFMRENHLQNNDQTVQLCMKKFGVVEFFKEQLRQGKEVIFKV